MTGVAEDLAVSEATVRSHLRSICAKADTSGRAELVFALLRSRPAGPPLSGRRCASRGLDGTRAVDPCGAASLLGRAWSDLRAMRIPNALSLVAIAVIACVFSAAMRAGIATVLALRRLPAA